MHPGIIEWYKSSVTVVYVAAISMAFPLTYNQILASENNLRLALFDKYLPQANQQDIVIASLTMNSACA